MSYDFMKSQVVKMDDEEQRYALFSVAGVKFIHIISFFFNTAKAAKDL